MEGIGFSELYMVQKRRRVHKVHLGFQLDESVSNKKGKLSRGGTNSDLREC